LAQRPFALEAEQLFLFHFPTASAVGLRHTGDTTRRCGRGNRNNKEDTMGSSPSIEELKAADDKFEAYLKERRIEIEARRKETREQMDADIAKFYLDGKWNDRRPLFSSEYVDVQNMSDWSLASVNNILKGISGAVFGSDNPPPGTTVGSDVSTNEVIQKIPSLQLLVMSAAFRAIQGILEAFVLKSSTTITMSKRIDMVAPGVTIFVYVSSNSFQQQSFFKNSLISQYFYLAEAYTSVQQLGDYSVFQDKLLFEKEKERLRDRAEKITKTMDAAVDIAALEAITKMLDFVYDRLKAVTDRIKNIDDVEHESLMSLSHQVRLRKSLMLAR
jgi:hypothetical protein